MRMVNSKQQQINSGKAKRGNKMSIVSHSPLRIVLGAMLVVALVLAALPANPAWALGGNVTASGTNNAKISITIGDGSAEFGLNLDPEGTNSDSTDTVADYQGSTGNQGSYYVWKSTSGTGLSIEVKSNMVWNGTYAATENGGAGAAASMTIASGVLLFSEGSEPTTYALCSSATALTTLATAWKTSIGAGNNTYTHYYCLRVDWDDDPGTFSSTVTYTVTQV